MNLNMEKLHRLSNKKHNYVADFLTYAVENDECMSDCFLNNP